MRESLSANGVTEAAKEAEDIDGALHFTAAFGESFAFFAGEEFGQLRFFAFEDLRGLAENASAGNAGERAPMAEGFLGGVDRMGGIFGGAGGIFCNALAGVSGVVSLKGAAGPGWDPIASDEIGIGFHDNKSGEDLIIENGAGPGSRKKGSGRGIYAASM